MQDQQETFSCSLPERQGVEEPSIPESVRGKGQAVYERGVLDDSVTGSGLEAWLQTQFKRSGV